MTDVDKLARRYADFMGEDTFVLREPDAENTLNNLPSEAVLQAYWLSGALGRVGATTGGERVEIRDFGIWNRSAGPDFLQCEVLVGDRLRRGAIELDMRPENWEEHGHGVNPSFDDVVLHVTVFSAGRGVWYTRNSRHEEIPLMVLDQSAVAEALALPRNVPEARLNLCRTPLVGMSPENLEDLFQSAAAYRVACKREKFAKRVNLCGEAQAWYECWAETLGYRVNKEAMGLLAHRAPLVRLGRDAEAILFGTAGFLVPILPERTGDEARNYHASVWDRWWKIRDEWELRGERRLPWRFSGIRPQNHPHRRLGALVSTVQRWKEIMGLLRADKMKSLTEWLTSLEHPYWSYYFCLPSAPLKRKTALIGESRVRDFLVNHVLPYDNEKAAWAAYCSLCGGAAPASVKQTARHLFGEEGLPHRMMGLAYVQQALLQIRQDYCALSACQDCLFPDKLRYWRKK